VPTPIIYTLDDVELTGELLDTPAAQAIVQRLPLDISLSRWGEEFYGDVGAPLGNLPGDKQEIMEAGDLAFWEPGNALCLFWGPTPASRSDEPRAASAVHRVGKVQGNFSLVAGLGYSVKASLIAAI
jgi:hypothetical protein